MATMELEQLQAYDSQTGRLLSPEDAERAADNPMMYRWVEWR